MNLTLFDLDGTLIDTDSDHAFGEFLVERGWADRERFRQRNDAFYADYLAGRLDQAAYIDFATAPWRARDPQEVHALRPGLRIAIVSGHVNEALLAAAAAAGVSDVLGKQDSMDALAAAVRALIETPSR